MLGTLLANGVELPMALGLAKDVLWNTALADAVRDTAASLREGESFARRLAQFPVFASGTLDLIRIGEETGKLDEMLIRQADLDEQRVKHTIDRLLAMLVPALTVLLGLVIAGLIALDADRDPERQRSGPAMRTDEPLPPPRERLHADGAAGGAGDLACSPRSRRPTCCTISRPRRSRPRAPRSPTSPPPRHVQGRCRRYPTTQEGLQALLKAPSDAENWDGPYIKKLDSFSDPWGRPYKYQSPGQHAEYDIYSYGPNKQAVPGASKPPVANW